jgi:phosphohistidine phosphatase
MRLTLLRHGKAEDSSMDGDFSRALVEKGREQSRSAAHLLKAAGALPDIVLTSPLLRARQTADEFCTAAAMPGPLIQSWLACGMIAEDALTQLRAFKDFKHVAIVGHEPDLSDLIESLLGVNCGAVMMKKGSIACVEWSLDHGHGTLLYLIPPKLAASWNED